MVDANNCHLSMHEPSLAVRARRTLIDKFKLRNDVESHLGELVPEHLYKHWEQMVNGSAETHVSFRA